MKPYTYLIGWPEHNTWYYGVRYATGCNPSDLWNPYTTSSKHVTAFVAEHGAPPMREMNKARKGLHYRKVSCCHCDNEYGAQVVKQHEKKCKSNLTSSVGNTDKTVYNNLVGSI